MDAKLGLNAGKILRLLITGDRAIGINSAAVAFDFEKGLGKSKAMRSSIRVHGPFRQPKFSLVGKDKEEGGKVQEEKAERQPRG
jgi:hypothetical protein